MRKQATPEPVAMVTAKHYLHAYTSCPFPKFHSVPTSSHLSPPSLLPPPPPSSLLPPPPSLLLPPPSSFLLPPPSQPTQWETASAYLTYQVGSAEVKALPSSLSGSGVGGARPKGARKPTSPSKTKTRRWLYSRTSFLDSLCSTVFPCGYCCLDCMGLGMQVSLHCPATVSLLPDSRLPKVARARRMSTRVPGGLSHGRSTLHDVALTVPFSFIYNHQGVIHCMSLYNN